MRTPRRRRAPMGALLVAATVTALVAGAAPANAAAPDAGVYDADPVERIAGADRVATSVAASREGWQEAPTVVVASAADFPDALAAAPLAAGSQAPLLLTWPDALPGRLTEELRRLAPSTVVVVGGEAAVDAATARAAGDAADAAVVRHGGSDRWASAAAAATAADTSGGEVLLASGAEFADALAAGGLSGGDHPSPVLLTAPNELPAATRAALRELEPDRITIVGGEAAVGGTVAGQAWDYADEVVRLGGATRFETSLAVLAEARRRAPGTLEVLVASGTRFPDALAAGALAGRLDGQVALAAPARIGDGLDRWLRETSDVSAARLLGGPAALSAHVRSELAAAGTGAPRPWRTHTSPAGFRGVAGPLPPAAREAMTGTSWEPGCPVGLDELAWVELAHHTFTGEVADGVLVARRDVAGDVLTAFAAAHAARLPIERMRPIADYDGDDAASMEANNTSAFNCRTITGGDAWSAHAGGTAVDVNPVQNPYRRGEQVLPAAGEAYLDRDHARPGMLARPGPLVDAFDALGWEWGGDWRSLSDWMHFEAPASG